MTIKIPFVSATTPRKPDAGFLDMIANRICPTFQLVSLSTALLGACMIVFILSRIMYSPGGYR